MQSTSHNEIAAASSDALNALPPKSLVRVVALDAADEDARRLKALGLCAGRQLELVKAGDPLIVRVLGARVGISARLAAQVKVRIV